MVLLLLILLPGDPHVLERGQASQDTASLPAHGASRARGEQSGFSLAGEENLEFLDDSFRETLEHGVSS